MLQSNPETMMLFAETVMSDEQEEYVPRLHKSASACAVKTRLESEFLLAIRRLMKLHAQQTQALIDGDPDFSRFDVLIHMASERKDLAKYALISHVESHNCGKD